MRRRALLSTVGATVIAGCGGRLGDDATDPETTTNPETAPDSETTTESGTADPETTRATTTDSEPSLELTSHDLVRSNEGSESELATVTGTVRNATDETVPSATVTATFEDGDGETLDRASANASDLSPGGSWSFELVYPATGEDARAVADYSLTVEAGD